MALPLSVFGASIALLLILSMFSKCHKANSRGRLWRAKAGRHKLSKGVQFRDSILEADTLTIHAMVLDGSWYDKRQLEIIWDVIVERPQGIEEEDLINELKMRI